MSEENASEQELDLGDIGIDIESLEDISKLDLIPILTGLAGDDDDSTNIPSKVPNSPSKHNAPLTDTTTTKSSEEQSDSVDKTILPDSDLINFSDKKSSRKNSEGSDGYQRPSELDLALGTTVLVECEEQDERKVTARHDLLGVSEYSDRNVLLIQYNPINIDKIKEITTRSNQVKIITIGYTQSVPQPFDGVVETVEIEDPTDVTRLGILATGILGDWISLDGQTVVSFDSLDVLLQYKTSEATFRFLHILLGKLSSREAISHCFVNSSSIDRQAINTLKPLFDETLIIDTDRIYLE